MTKPSVLVTGGAGYIGSHACKALAAAGFSPVALDNLSKGHRWAVRFGPLAEGDIRDAALLDGVFAEYRPCGVLHFAAFSYVGESVADPGAYYHNNVGGTVNLLEAMRRAGCPPLIFSSTCATYGAPRQVPIPDDHPQEPINPYGRSKLMIETMLRDYEAAYGLRSAALRYFNAAGADPDGELGECHEPETHLIPLALAAARGRLPRLEVFGDDYPTPDGTAVRDYIHVTDLAEAHVLALKRLLDGAGGFFCNLGAGRGHSVLEVIRCVERVSGRGVPRIVGPRRPGDPPRLVAGGGLAAELLGWTPRRPDLESMVETAWRWSETDCSRR